jgi:hypothetical protein
MMRAVVIGALLSAAACGFHPAGGGDDDDTSGDDGGNVETDAAPTNDPDASDIDAAPNPTTDAAVDARIDAPTQTTLCPLGYAAINGSSTQYRIVEVNTTWAVAEADCNDDDDLVSGVTGHTHLVVVGDATEKTLLTNQSSGNTWVGLSDEAVEGTFVWVTNENTNGFPVVGQQPPWDAGDPDGGATENCVRFKNSFDFEDKACTDSNSYICECDSFRPN